MVADSRENRGSRTEWLVVSGDGSGRPSSNREAWLQRAIGEIRGLASQKGLELGPVLISVSKPSRRIHGCCYARKHSAAGNSHIFISSELSDPVEVLGVVAHEAAHAIDDCRNHHRGEPYKRICRALGLQGGGPDKRQFTQTEWTEAGRAWASGVVERLGPYGHDPLKPFVAAEGGGEGEEGPAGPGSRMLKTKCPTCDYFVRTTRRRLMEQGPPICPRCFVPLGPVDGNFEVPDSEVPWHVQMVQTGFARLHGEALRDFLKLVVMAEEKAVRAVLAELDAERRPRLAPRLDGYEAVLTSSV